MKTNDDDSDFLRKLGTKATAQAESPTAGQATGAARAGFAGHRRLVNRRAGIVRAGGGLVAGSMLPRSIRLDAEPVDGGSVAGLYQRHFLGQEGISGHAR